MHICSNEENEKKIAAFANDLEHAYVLLCHPSRPPCDVIMFKSLEYTFLYTHYTVWKKPKFTPTWKHFVKSIYSRIDVGWLLNSGNFRQSSFESEILKFPYCAHSLYASRSYVCTLQGVSLINSKRSRNLFKIT